MTQDPASAFPIVQPGGSVGAWYVVLIASPTDIKGRVHAEVARFADAMAYHNATGADPSNVLPDAWQGTNGFATKLQAQAVAARFNALPPDQKQIGSGVPLAPSVATIPKVVTNPLDFLKELADLAHRLTEPATWLRVAEVVAGLTILYVALKAVTTPGGAQVATRKAGSTFKDAGKYVTKKVVFK